MKKKYSLILFIFFLIINSCEKKIEHSVSWNPMKPKFGETIRIIYNPQSSESHLVDASQLTLICQFYTNNTDSILIVPMKKVKKLWQSDLKPPENTCLISYKFEDDLNRTDDNNGRGWSIIVTDKAGKIVKNTHYNLGQIYLGRIRPEAFPYYKKAIEEFDEELRAYPENYKSWFDKWDAEINLFENVKTRINQKLDSLLAINPTNPELFMLAFNTNYKILHNKSQAIHFAEQLTNSSPQAPNVDEIVYSSIFLKFDNDLQQQLIALERFTFDFPQSHLIESAYFRLGNYYLQLKFFDKAKLMFEKMRQFVPDDVDNIITIATMEIKHQNYERAQQLLEAAKGYCTEIILRKKNPWVHPGKRINQLNYNLCQIYSTIANLNYMEKSYQEAIKNRKTVIELGTPFPAFEWTGIGNAYIQLKNNEQAEKAFIKALSIDPDQQDAIQKLRKLYINKTKSEIGFEQYIDTAIKTELKASAKFAPDFEVVDLDNNKYKLSDLKGKIVVLNFWDTWSAACIREITQLNKLVTDFKNVNFVDFWAISSEYKSTIEKFLQNTKFNYHQFYNGNDVKQLYQIIGVPTHLIIDSNGYLRYKYIGFTPNIKQRLKENIQFLLQESNIIS